ncbi:hypothetical protein [Marinilabilia rubra]|uniref:Uncharacterized protein n=1 Tax=Marinilabilia rubra TaxID=2162893 RepID=A0A2U2B533_9BACT|nr:hypothetical protein [Marinilabilia rubra]PWD98147.1 hypothetical protein DDZ16_16775 [Marinilabilia rubra]
MSHYRRKAPGKFSGFEEGGSFYCNMVISEANEILQEKIIPVSVMNVSREGKHILFLFGGMIDNCYGIAFAPDGKKSSENDCGQFTTWQKKEENWYIWTTQ